MLVHFWWDLPDIPFFSKTRDCGYLYILKTSCKVFLLWFLFSWTWDHAICPAPDHLVIVPLILWSYLQANELHFLWSWQIFRNPRVSILRFFSQLKRKAPEFRYSSEEGIKGKMAFPYTSGWLSRVSPLSTMGGGQALIGIVINIIPFLISGMWVRSYTGFC